MSPKYKDWSQIIELIKLLGFTQGVVRGAANYIVDNDNAIAALKEVDKRIEEYLNKQHENFQKDI